MKLKFKDQQLTLYNSIDDCRTDSNKKGYGCVKRGSLTYYFDLVPTSDTWASKLRYKKKSNGTTYAIANSNLVSLNGWAKTKYPSTYQTITSISSSDITYLKSIRGISMSGMFSECLMLKTLDMSGWDLSKVTNMSSMFFRCEKLENFDISNLNLKSVTTMASMFRECKMNNVKVSNSSTSNVTDMSYMFYRYKGTSLNVSNLNTSKVLDMTLMISETEIDSLDLSKWNTSNVVNMGAMLSHNTNLITLDLSNFDTTNVFNATNMFFLDDNLRYIIIGSSTFKFQMKDSNCGQLNTTCKILVPNSLLNTFKTATNWSSRASQFDAIENYNITRSNGKVTVTHK